MTALPTEPVDVDLAALQAAEVAIASAIKRRDPSTLSVLGFGEISVAVGWPAAAPTMVLKRGVVYDNRARSEYDANAIADYIAALQTAGAPVIPTTTHVVDRDDGRFVSYAVQPLLAPELLAETTIENDTPRADHPLVRALRDFAVKHVTPRLSADMQFTNFAWDGERLALLDITSPLVFDDNGDMTLEISPEMLSPVPAFMRKLTLKEALRVGQRYRSLPDTFSFVLVLLLRIGQDRWVPHVAEAFNDVLDEPIDLAEVHRDFDRYKKLIPFINRSCMLQRWWVTRVRRQPYEFFITDSFTGDVL